MNKGRGKEPSKPPLAARFSERITGGIHITYSLMKTLFHQNLNGTLPTDPYITKLRSSYFFMPSGFFGVRGSCGFDFLDLYIKSNEHLPKNAMEAAA